MEKMLIKKSVDMVASREKIWAVLITEEYNQLWYSEFGAGSVAVTDWQEGSKVIFMDHSKSGLAGIITSHKPGIELIIDYNGVVTDGQEDYESELARSVIGYKECYWLSSSESSYKLDIEVDMGDEYFDFMSEAWDRALLKIKELAEEN